MAEAGEVAQDVSITYGISDLGFPEHQGVVRIGDIRRGRIVTDQPGRTGAAEPKASRAVLQEGDLAVVLVRRVGDAALVTADHEAWIATRGVGIIRAKDPAIARWLRIWLQTPRARAWIDQHVSAHVEPTLSLDALRKMPVSVPPPEQIQKIHELITVIEAKAELNLSIAAHAIELADAYHANWERHNASWSRRQFGAVADAKTGTGKPPSEREGPRPAQVTPSEILGASLPYIDGIECLDLAAHPGAFGPGTILVATRSGGARVAVTRRPAIPGRGVLAVRPAEPTDLLWLLHELRSRCGELSQVAQGRSAREITRRAFLRLEVEWPGKDVREQFHRVAEPMHSRAQMAVDENRSLHDLRSRLLRDISSRSRTLFRPGSPDPHGGVMAEAL
ncbi:hypothetical protein MTF65_01830 [Streptomyces sp. APSN-46.1]|uniref:hypothetical protein n=1 Tax=Streptomyces sp. APSN-46.1 TaxID=2929049 RepID=UPI001FB38B8E|nr:hypothetical protein [Streptomyces sp. APSN-46.1]MCJ1676122.1 hypothetical protein [Streptomyces sp. APSN-46.1]